MILAAGYGMRMVPINMETPKGLLEVEGEPLIERLIRQLHAVKVKEIYVVVGFKKEQYDYLVDQYGVKLVVNMEYAEEKQPAFPGKGIATAWRNVSYAVRPLVPGKSVFGV